MDEELKKLLLQAAAGKMLADLSGEQRDRIVQAGIAKALDGYQFTSTLNEVVLERATRIMRNLIETGEYDRILTAAITKGLGEVAAALPGAVRGAILEALAGEERQSGSYGGKCGLLLGHLKEKKS